MGIRRLLAGPFAFIVFAALITGCGGGGGGGGAAPTGTQTNGPPVQPVVAARVWSSATLIEHEDTGLLVMDPMVSIDDAGNANVVWIQQLSTANVASNRFSVTSGWGTPAGVNIGSASRARIVGDGNGGAIAIWEQMFNGISSSRFAPATGWGSPEPVANPGALGALFPRIGLAADGTAIAVWQQGDGFRTNIWANRRTPAGWGTAALIETNDTVHAADPELAVETNGDAIAMWWQTPMSGGAEELWANYYTGGVGWGTPQPVATGIIFGESLQVAFDGRGNALAAWTASSSIWASHFTAGQGWGAPFLLETHTAQAHSPRVGFDAQGNGMALWIQQDTVPNPFPCAVVLSVGGGSGCATTITTMNLWSRRYTPAGGWETPQLVDTTNFGPVSSPAFAFDGAGNAVAVWLQRADLFNSVVTVWANRYASGTGWGTATVIQDQATGTALSPSIAVNADGQAVVAWGQSDGTRANAWANLLQ